MLAEDSEKFWEFFSFARQNWKTTYDDFLSAEFDEKVEGLQTPKIYKRIWTMRKTRQVFTLNVDGLVARAFREERASTKNSQLFEYDGFSVVDSLSFLARDSFCCMNLHGTYHEKSRWIMDAEQRDALFNGPYGEKYKAFATRLFSEYNIVFVGLNPADVAISPFLKSAASIGVLGRHFWICPNPNEKTKAWAQRNGIRVISYSPEKSESGHAVHSQDICAILDQVEDYVSKDRSINLPKEGRSLDPDSLGSPVEMVQALTSDRKDVTRQLNAAMNWIGERDGYSSPNASGFLKKYSVPIQIACTLDDITPGFNEIGSYELIENIQSRGSSSVWLARNRSDENEAYRAVKSLNSNGIQDITERHSFRRGIESLFLLQKVNRKVAPSFVKHQEIPLCVIMEYINGESLKTFQNKCGPLRAKMAAPLCLDIFSAVLACHQSEGGILHRDIKPGNILLEGWHEGYEPIDALNGKVRLINFDLSWHRFTSGNTKAISADDIGYYAPEQRLSANTLPPRDAATDVYMLGMVLYFCLSARNPPDGGATTKDWTEEVRRGIRSCVSDKLIHHRLTRLIVRMTEVEPSKRIDLSNAIGEIETIISWMNEDWDSVDDDMIVELLALSTGRNYVWIEEAYTAEVSARESTKFNLQYVHRGKRAQFSFHREKSGTDNRANFGEKMKKRISSSAQVLKDAGWNVSTNSNKGIDADIRVSELRRMKGNGADVWSGIANQLLASFE
ncbi:serine/threonine protein kinase [Rhodobacter sp. 140A]|nr:serine/threonine protein kinase [Rhodobacter sp. 140A]